MLFNSLEFIFVFLPITVCGYFALNEQGYPKAAKIFLLFASLFFYGWWNPNFIPLIMISMTFNFTIGYALNRTRSKPLFVLGLIFNIALLGFFKYFNFVVENINYFLDDKIGLEAIILPLGISFFTFQQIAYLADSYKGVTSNYDFFDYCLFIAFFPQLIAGPIVHHQEVMPQFFDVGRRNVNYENLSKGLFFFVAGLAKKVIIADTFALIASKGFSAPEYLMPWEAWITTFSYSIQLYFDFSGYSDMAIGLGLMFNISLPINFNSPYKAINIQDFWRRWHITLSRFLRDYIYIPLGGSRNGEWKTVSNLLVTFLIGGIWHGAGWTFIAWGFLHGVALVIHRQFNRLGMTLSKWVSIPLTFLFVNFAWIFFRAESWQAASTLSSRLLGIGDVKPGFVLVNDLYSLPVWIAALILLFSKNTQEIAESFTLTRKYAFYTVTLIVLNFIFLNSSINQEFLYFDF